MADLAKTMTDYLFFYGTLIPGYAPKEIAGAVDKLLPVGEGMVYGELYDLGFYPGAVLDPSSPKAVYGKVFRLPEDEDLLPALDEYEGFDPADLSGSLFVRQVHPVALTTGKVLHCWVYVYNQDPSAAPIIRSGRFLSR